MLEQMRDYIKMELLGMLFGECYGTMLGYLDGTKIIIISNNENFRDLIVEEFDSDPD